MLYCCVVQCLWCDVLLLVCWVCVVVLMMFCVWLISCVDVSVVVYMIDDVGSVVM